MVLMRKKPTDCINRLQLEKHGVIVNVGANVGLMAVFLAKKFERNTIAIEPNPEDIRYFEEKHYNEQVGSSCGRFASLCWRKNR